MQFEISLTPTQVKSLRPTLPYGLGRYKGEGDQFIFFNRDYQIIGTPIVGLSSGYHIVPSHSGKDPCSLFQLREGQIKKLDELWKKERKYSNTWNYYFFLDENTPWNCQFDLQDYFNILTKTHAIVFENWWS